MEEQARIYSKSQIKKKTDVDVERSFVFIGQFDHFKNTLMSRDIPAGAFHPLPTDLLQLSLIFAECFRPSPS